jgi:hypothetical protein
LTTRGPDGNLWFAEAASNEVGTRFIVGHGAALLYDGTSGVGLTARLEPDGSFVSLQEYTDFSTGWTHITPLGYGMSLFYNANTGFSGTGYLDLDGNFTTLQNFYLATGWTHIVWTGAANGTNYLLFYKASNDYAAMGQVNQQGIYSDLQGFYIPGNWTHICAAPDLNAPMQNVALLFFYKSSTGTAFTAHVDSNGSLVPHASYSGLSANWTHLVWGGRRSDGWAYLLFYRNDTHTGTTARVRDDFTSGFQALQTYTNFAGLSHIATGTNGIMLFYNADFGMVDTGKNNRRRRKLRHFAKLQCRGGLVTGRGVVIGELPRRGHLGYRERIGRANAAHRSAWRRTN